MHRPVYFYHIRKTGGTSLNFAFFSISGKDPQKIYNKLNSKNIVEENGFRFVRDRKDVFEGSKYTYGFSHQPCHKLRIPSNVLTYTCFRDPVDRVLSIYRAMKWKKKAGHHRPGHIYLGKNFMEFLKKLPKKRLLEQLYMFSSSFDTNKALEVVKSCSYYFFLEDIELGIRRLSELSGFVLPNLHVNKSEYNFKPTNMELDKLKAVLSPEINFINKLKGKNARKK